MAGDPRYTTAARRWLCRFVAERSVELNEALTAGAALAELEVRPHSAVARDTLTQLLEPPP
jgi:hypothetical protein